MYKILAGYFDKQFLIVEKLYFEIVRIDVAQYVERFVFSVKIQQLYSSLEALFKHIAKAFENRIQELSLFPKELLLRMNLEIAENPSRLSFKTKLASFG